MEAVIYLNTSTKTARAGLTGSALPNVPAKFQAHLKLTVSFFATGAAAALLNDATTFNVTIKALDSAGGDLFAQKVAPDTVNADSYEFEWATLGNTALETAIGDSIDGIAAVLTIGWTLAGTVEKIDIPITIANTWQRTDDYQPDLSPFQTSITTNGYLRLVNSAGDVFHLGLNTGEPPA